MSEPPQVLRIKRKRGQDPLQALILQDRLPKRSKPSSPISSGVQTPAESKSWYFQLARTDSADNQEDVDVLASVLSESQALEESRRFVIPKQQTIEDAVIPNELADMVDSFLTVDAGTTRKKRRGGRVANPEPEVEPVTQKEDEDFQDEYVFDVYRLSDTEPLTNANFPQSQIGYIRFFDDDEYDLMQSDDDTDSLVSDNEDSNAESFYQNDYPEDEDAGAYSDTYDDDEDAPVIMETPEALEGSAYLHGEEQQNFDELYDDYFEHGQKGDLLSDSFYENDETFERQKFFAGDDEDDLALHRDRIFGRLQKMIDEKD